MTAAVVTIAVVLCCALSWYAAKQQMLGQVKDTLQQSYAHPGGGERLTFLCSTSSGPTGHGFEPTDTTPTLIFASGLSCPSSDPRAVKITASDVALANSGTGGPNAPHTFREGRTVGGTRVMIYTVSYGPQVVVSANGTEVTADVAVAFAQPLAPVDHALAELGLLLLLIGLVVIAGALIAAWYVARTGLRPVDKLTAAVEHIARTEEVGTTIEVNGEDEIARLSTSFNSMSTALASSRERQSQLIADAGHELRTPLTSLRTNVDLLVRSDDTGRPLPEETRTRLLRNMKAQMGELSTLIGDLLELSRPTRPQGAKPLEVVALHDIAARALDRARLRGPGLEFTVAIDPWYVRADAHALERAVINLLDNAVKFSPPGGTIDLGLHFGTLTVRDQGPGIPEEDLSRVFERFWRSPAARQMPGSGLGLAIVSQTVQDCGGEVALSNAHPGTLATMKLPGAPTPPPELPSTI
ncbi:sensor histidine kinase [Streptacidiphilus anmyonensis]|uniref:sensor histidine kinase n=1 Tax=Streptacidiphilus anmyonensis TaxID=405782 RepID=UPI001F33C493|nr:HAMP domain-containing sensor histidine kinase [Streptacidiphilus anmyonensis]